MTYMTHITLFCEFWLIKQFKDNNFILGIFMPDQILLVCTTLKTGQYKHLSRSRTYLCSTFLSTVNNPNHLDKNCSGKSFLH